MNVSVVLAVVSLFAFGVGSFVWQIVGAKQVYAPSYMIVEGIVFAFVGVLLHFVERKSFNLSYESKRYAVLAGLLAGIAVYALILAFSMGGAGSVIFPVSRLGMIISVALAIIVFNEPITSTKVLGLGLGISSIIVLSS